MKIPSITTNVLAGTILGTVVLCTSAQGQWVTWEVSAGGNGHMYQAVQGFPGLTWTLADQLAQQAGGYLATITSSTENDFVFNLVNSSAFFTGFNGSGPALGGVQLDGSAEPAGGWTWTTGETWSYTNWLPGQPDNGVEGEDRLHYFSNIGSTPAATWNDIYRDDSNLGGYVIEAVPEPGAMGLFGIGVLLWVRQAVKRQTPVRLTLAST